MYFPSTQWSLLAKASLNGETSARDALEELCRRYWQPIFQFIRSRGFSETEAQDLTQAFLLHLLERSALKKPDRLKGRFRSFLLGSLNRFIWDELDRRNAEKRGGGHAPASLDDSNLHLETEPSHPAPDSTAFDREWALVVLETSLARVQEDYVGEGKADMYSVLRHFLPGAVRPMAYEDAAARLRMGLSALKSEIHRMRMRFRSFVRQEIAGTVGAPHEIDEEMEYLRKVLMQPGNDLETTEA